MRPTGLAGLDQLNQVHRLGDVDDAHPAQMARGEAGIETSLGIAGDQDVRFQIFGGALDPAGQAHGISLGAVLEFLL